MLLTRTFCLPFLVLLSCLSCQPSIESSKTEEATADSTNTNISYLTESVEQLWQTDSVFQTPESVVYDPARQKLYVSNIAGSPIEKNGQGFISVVDLNGQIQQLKWIEGLNAPKGLYLLDDLLYIADLDQLVIVSILEGSILKKIDIPDAKFLNDITYLPDSEVILVTDTERHRIYWLDANGQTGIWVENEQLMGPNGIIYHDNSLLIASFSGQRLFSMDPVQLDLTTIANEIGAGDGILITSSGDTIVSDFGGKIFQLNDQQAQLIIDLSTINENAADIAWAERPGLLLVPTFFGNTVRAFKLLED